MTCFLGRADVSICASESRPKGFGKGAAKGRSRIEVGVQGRL